MRDEKSSFFLSTTTDEIGVSVRLKVLPALYSFPLCTLLIRHMHSLIVFFSLCSSFPDNMSTVDWSEGKWKPYGKDLETALQSEEAQACTR